MLTSLAGGLITAITNSVGLNNWTATAPFDDSSSFFKPRELNKRSINSERVVPKSIEPLARSLSRENIIEGLKSEKRIEIETLPYRFPTEFDYSEDKYMSGVFGLIKNYHENLTRVIDRTHNSSSKMTQEYLELQKFLHEPPEEVLTTDNVQIVMFEMMRKFNDLAVNEVGGFFIPAAFMEIMGGKYIINSAILALNEVMLPKLEGDGKSIKFDIKTRHLKKIVWQRVLSCQQELLRELRAFILNRIKSRLKSRKRVSQDENSTWYTESRESGLWLNARIMTDIQQLRDEIFTLMNYREKIQSQIPYRNYYYAYVTDITPKSNEYADSSIEALTLERLNDVIKEILRVSHGGEISATKHMLFMQHGTWTIESYRDCTYPECYLYVDETTNDEFRLRRVDRSSNDRSILLADLNPQHLTRIYKILHSVCQMETKRADHIWLVEEYLPFSAPRGVSSEEYLGPVTIGGVAGYEELKTNRIKKSPLKIRDLRGRAGLGNWVFKIDQLNDIVLEVDNSPYTNPNEPSPLTQFYRELTPMSDTIGLIGKAILEPDLPELSAFFDVSIDAEVNGLRRNNNFKEPYRPVIARTDLMTDADNTNSPPADVHGDGEEHSNTTTSKKPEGPPKSADDHSNTTTSKKPEGPPKSVEKHSNTTTTKKSHGLSEARLLPDIDCSFIPAAPCSDSQSNQEPEFVRKHSRTFTTKRPEKLPDARLLPDIGYRFVDASASRDSQINQESKLANGHLQTKTTGRPEELPGASRKPDTHYAFSAAPTPRTGFINQCIDFLKSVTQSNI